MIDAAEQNGVKLQIGFMRRHDESFEEAKKAHDAFLPFMDELFITANPIMVKEALNLIGFPVGGVRLPLVDATPEQSAELAQVMKEVGVL